MRYFKTHITIVCLITMSGIWANAQGEHIYKHAHNDYEHRHPLWTALQLGFHSIEVDIFRLKDELIVSHDDKDLEAKPSLEALYLKPLLNLNLDDYNLKWLFVDLKSTDSMTFQLLHTLLRRYSQIISTIGGIQDSVKLQVIISGDYDRAMISGNEEYTYFHLDGRPEHLGVQFNMRSMPLISTNFKDIVKWKARKNIDRKDALKLYELISQVHEEGKRIRFWNVPEEELAWQVLLGLGVDVISVDDYISLTKFLEKRQF